MKNDRRLGGEGAGDGDALLHAAGKLARPLVGEFGLGPTISRYRRPFCRRSRRGTPLRSSPNSTLPMTFEPGKQRVVLEYHAAVDVRPASPARRRPAFRPPTVRSQTRENVEQGGLAAAGRPDNDQKFAGRNVEVDRQQRLDHAAVRRLVLLGKATARTAAWRVPWRRRASFALSNCNAGRPSGRRKLNSTPSMPMVTMPTSTIVLNAAPPCRSRWR